MGLLDHLKHRLSPKTIAKEVGSALDNQIAQGRDELTNALFNGSAYWPGQSVDQNKIVPMPTDIGPAQDVAEIGPPTPTPAAESEHPQPAQELLLEYRPLLIEDGRDRSEGLDR